MSIFVNLTAHPLTDEQRNTAEKELGVTDFVEYKDTIPYLFNKMVNSPDDPEKLERLAVGVIHSLEEMICDCSNVYFHLPLGSPAFNFIFAGIIANLVQFKGKILFSHSERVSKEIALPNGTVRKENVFKFVRFIKF